MLGTCVLSSEEAPVQQVLYEVSTNGKIDDFMRSKALYVLYLYFLHMMALDVDLS